jgi:hypothetical protein
MPMMVYKHPMLSGIIFLQLCLVMVFQEASAQKNAVVQVHADKSSGYGVSYGGPKNLPDRIVTALHVVAGKKTILVVWQGKSATATVEKIYKASDLALLKLNTSLGIPSLSVYSGEPPYDTNINFWEVPVNTSAMTAKTSVLEERTSLSRISPRVSNNAAGLSKSLCIDAGQYYPGMTTEVINFKEPNIRKAHSGSPITYGDKILGLVDGGAKLIDGKSCVWAIPASEFTKLFNLGTAPAATLQACGGTSGNAYMYSGTRSDNPLLSPEEAEQAAQFERPMDFTSGDGNSLTLYHDYRMSFEEVWETLFPEAQSDLEGILESETEISIADMFESGIDIYIEELTGISVMVPSQCQLNIISDQSQTFITTTSPGGLITMSFYISINDGMEEGLANMQGFKSAMVEIGHVMDAKEEDIADYTDDPENPYYSEYVENALTDANGEITGEFFADLIINDGDFLAITISISDWSQLENNPEERMFLYLMETCGLLSDFSIY